MSQGYSQGPLSLQSYNSGSINTTVFAMKNKELLEKLILLSESQAKLESVGKLDDEAAVGVATAVDVEAAVGVATSVDVATETSKIVDLRESIITQLFTEGMCDSDSASACSASSVASLLTNSTTDLDDSIQYAMASSLLRTYETTKPLIQLFSEFVASKTFDFNDWLAPRITNLICGTSIGIDRLQCSVSRNITTEAFREFVTIVKTKVSETVMSDEELSQSQPEDTAPLLENELVVPAAYFEVILMYYLNNMIRNFNIRSTEITADFTQSRETHNRTLETMHREGLLYICEKFLRILASVEDFNATAIVHGLNAAITLTVGESGQRVDQALGAATVKQKIRALCATILRKLDAITNLTAAFSRIKEFVTKIQAAAAEDSDARIIAALPRGELHEFPESLYVDSDCSSAAADGGCSIVLRESSSLSAMEEGEGAGAGAGAAFQPPSPPPSYADASAGVARASVLGKHGRDDEKGGKRKTMKRKNSKTIKRKQKKSNKLKKTIRRRKTRK